MAVILDCFIEEVKGFHPELELEHLILSSVSVMKKYSDNFCDFHLECRDILSNLLPETGSGQIRVRWQRETQRRAERMAKTHQQKDLVEFAAIAITCILFPQIVNLLGLDSTEEGDKADYWIHDRAYLVEISGTENPREFRGRHREKIKQLLDNPYRKEGYVVVCDFSKKRILLSFHKQEEKQ